MAASINYPDILGAITRGARANFGVIHAALTVRPAVPRAGRPFEVLLLIQNTCDADIELTATLVMPDVDARKQKERFIVKVPRVVAGIKAAEVGYVTIPVHVAPDAAPAQGYKLSVDFNITAHGKPQRLRAENGGGAVDPQFLPVPIREKMLALRGLTYSVAKRSGRNTLDLTFELAPRNLDNSAPDLHTGWVSLCKVSDYKDDRYLLHRYGSVLQVKTLPQLKRALLYETFTQTTQARFKEAGYALYPAEAGLIAKLLTLILEYASPRHTGHGHIAAGIYNVDGLIARDPFTLEGTPYIPHWMRGLIAMIEKDVRAAEHPITILTRYAYEDILRDGVNYAFEMIEQDTGEEVGAPDERANYREKLIARLKAKNGLDFSTVYLPLVMGGMIVSDRVMLPKESPADLLKEVSRALEHRVNECGDDDDPIVVMSQDILWRTGQKYGIKLS